MFLEAINIPRQSWSLGRNYAILEAETVTSVYSVRYDAPVDAAMKTVNCPSIGQILQ